MNKLTQSIFWIVNTVLFIAVAIVAYTFINIDMKKLETFKVVSSSMVPTLNINDIVLAKKMGNYHERLKTGDIIIFNRPNDNKKDKIIHRIKTINIGGEITTKGDFNPVEDNQKITAKDVIAVYETSYNKEFGAFLLGVMKYRSFVMLATVFWMIFVASNFIFNKFYNEDKEIMRKKTKNKEQEQAEKDLDDILRDLEGDRDNTPSNESKDSKEDKIFDDDDFDFISDDEIETPNRTKLDDIDIVDEEGRTVYPNSDINENIISDHIESQNTENDDEFNLDDVENIFVDPVKPAEPVRKPVANKARPIEANKIIGGVQIDGVKRPKYRSELIKNKANKKKLNISKKVEEKVAPKVAIPPKRPLNPKNTKFMDIVPPNNEEFHRRIIEANLATKKKLEAKLNKEKERYAKQQREIEEIRKGRRLIQ